ncbi:MAG: hypothetical protein M1816_001443 [Peltula sp. TS41687]|nr:MAG: hypothetical protein M1816_001443 [Peltula sp. TS41687]
MPSKEVFAERQNAAASLCGERFYTSLHDVCDAGLTDKANILVVEGANIWANDDDFETPVALAIRRRHNNLSTGAELNRVFLLLRRWNLNSRESINYIFSNSLVQPLRCHDQGSSPGRCNLTRVLLKSEQHLVPTVEGSKALHIAVRRDMEKVVKLLIEKGIRTIVPDEHNRTVLQVAAYYQAKRVVKVLLQFADANQIGFHQLKALHIAAIHPDGAIVKLLMRVVLEISLVQPIQPPG